MQSSLLREINQRRLRLPRVGSELRARHRHGATVRTHRLGHSSVRVPVVWNQHGRVVGPVNGGMEVWRRAVGTADGQTAGGSGDDLGRRVPTRPGAAHIRLKVERLWILHRVSRQKRQAGGSIGSPHPPPAPVVPFLEHVFKSRVQHPVVALPVRPAVPRDLDEALIKRQIVPNAVLPSFLVLLIVWELWYDVFINPAQSPSLILALFDCHRDQSHVWVRRLLQLDGPVLILCFLRTFGLCLGRAGADIQQLHFLGPEGFRLCGHGSARLSAYAFLWWKRSVLSGMCHRCRNSAHRWLKCNKRLLSCHTALTVFMPKCVNLIRMLLVKVTDQRIAL